MTNNIARRGFASLSPKERARIAREGGRAAQQSGKAHKWTREEAQEAGRIGGMRSKGKAKQRRFKEEL